MHISPSWAVLALAGLMPSASAHYNFDTLLVNGVSTGTKYGYEYIRKMTNSNSPVTDVKSNDLRCNVGALANAATTKTYTVAAGSKVGFTVVDVIGHPGPLFAYMSKAPGSVSSYDGSGDWFKIYELGVKTFATDNTAATWASDGFKSVEFTIPKAIPSGEYLLRVEHIAVHGASTVGGSQFYMSCAQIIVTGGAGGTPKPVVKIPGVYSAQDPGIYFPVYWPPMKNYTMPGPAVYRG